MTINLPLTADALVQSALDNLAEERKMVEKAMVEEILPDTLDVIFKFNKSASLLVDKYKSVDWREQTKEISQTLWSYPGSFGLKRISENLLLRGLSFDDAEELAKCISNYTKYPMSIVNYMRHIQSAINSINGVIAGPKLPYSALEEFGVSLDFYQRWSRSCYQLSVYKINSENSFYDWMFMMEAHLKEFSVLQAKVAQARSGRINNPDLEKFLHMDSAVARAYSRRFSNYVAAHAKFNETSSNSKGLSSTVSDEFSDLLSVYKKPKAEIYKKLDEDFQKRANRISASTKAVIRPTLRSKSTIENFIEQKIKVNDKDVTVRASGTQLSKELVTHFLKSMSIEFDLNGSQGIFKPKSSMADQMLEIEIEQPEKRDLRKIQTYIESMYLS